MAESLGLCLLVIKCIIGFQVCLLVIGCFLIIIVYVTCFVIYGRVSVSREKYFTYEVI